MTTANPSVTWAQRSSDVDPEHNILYVTLVIPDLQDGYKLEFPTATRLSFEGKSKLDTNKTYKLDLELYGEVEAEEGKKESMTGKELSLVLRKKVLAQEFWPRLSKDKKVAFIKTDFSKWVDEDEQDEEPEQPQGGGMPGMGGGGMEGLAGMGGNNMGAGGMGGMDMEALMKQMQAGGAGGAGGMDFASMMSGMNAGGAGADFGDDDDMPELEDAAPSGKGKGKAAQADDDDDDMPPLE